MNFASMINDVRGVNERKVIFMEVHRQKNDGAGISTEQYIERLYGEDADLQRVMDRIREHSMPEISIPSGYGRLLTLLVKIAKAQKALEIGALGGYSGICIARGLPTDGRLLSLELEPGYAELAKENLQQAGLGGKVEYMIGDAKESLQTLMEKGEQFDFFFIDANKSGYPEYLKQSIAMSRPGAIIVGDNTMQRGKIMDESKQSSSLRAMREFNRMIAEHPRLDSAMLPAYDGLAIARVNE